MLPRRLLRAAVAYYFIGYVVLGIYLVIVNPTPGFGTAIADPRLLQPDFLGGLGIIAPEILLGLVCFLGVAYFASRLLMRSGRMTVRASPRPMWGAAAAVCLALGWLVRLYLISTSSTGGLAFTGIEGRISTLPTAALGLLIVCTNWRDVPWQRLLVVAAAAAELFWSVKVGSKTPLLATALFFYLDPGRKRISWQVAAVSCVGLLVAFVVIQPAKTDTAYGDYNGNQSLIVPVRILSRFDGLRGITDAVELGPGSYMRGTEFASQLALAWTPQSITGGQKTTSGVLWGLRMEGATSGVSLAEGATAEGYAVFGVLGVVVWNALLGAVIAMLGFSVQQRRSFGICLLATGLIASNAIFERGILGLNEGLSAAVQLAILGLVMLLLVRGIFARSLPRASAFAAR
jgi:hypothetical protein